MKQPISIHVRGKRAEWVFVFKGNPKHIPLWREDGLEVYEVESIVPMWVVELGLTKPWCFLRDAWGAIRLW